MPKFFVKNEQIYRDRIDIMGEDINHIKNVLRMKVNDELNICDQDNGVNYLATIASFEKDKIICMIKSELENKHESNTVITLYQGLPKFDKMEYIIQKCTEVGVSHFIPTSMKRCVVKFNEKDIGKKIERFNKIAEVAAKQSMRDIIPKVENISKIKDIVKDFDKYDIVLVAYEAEEDMSLKNVLNSFKLSKKDSKYNIAIVIGPEGGFDKEEIDYLSKDKKCKIVSLGKRILRAETAGLVMAGNIIYELEN